MGPQTGRTTTGSAGALGPGKRILRAPGFPVAAVLLLAALAFAALAAHETVHLRRIRSDGLVTEGQRVM